MNRERPAQADIDVEERRPSEGVPPGVAKCPHSIGSEGRRIEPDSRIQISYVGVSNNVGAVRSFAGTGIVLPCRGGERESGVRRNNWGKLPVAKYRVGQFTCEPGAGNDQGADYTLAH